MNGLSLHVGRGTHRDNLTVFPVWQERVEGRPVSIADDRLVMVSELAEPVVPLLQVTVVVTSAVLVLDGDVLVGGLQDRVAIGSTLWDRILETAAREAARAEDVVTYGYRAREFIGLVDQMKPSASSRSGVGRIVQAVNGPLELRGIADGERLLHASVTDRQVVAA